MKTLIFDSGPLINFSMNGFLEVLERLKQTFEGKFLITASVKYEVIDRPIKVQRFELGALRVQQLLNRKVLELPDSINIDNQELQHLTKQLFEQANHTLKVHDAWVNIVSEAEMSCLALSTLLGKRGTETIIAIDERTTRILCEDPRMLEQLVSDRLHQRAQIAAADLNEFKDYRFIRSSELVYVAYKKGVLGLEGKQALEAALYATKTKGTAISYEEIDVLKKLQ